MYSLIDELNVKDPSVQGFLGTQSRFKDPVYGASLLLPTLNPSYIDSRERWSFIQNMKLGSLGYAGLGTGSVNGDSVTGVDSVLPKYSLIPTSRFAMSGIYQNGSLDAFLDSYRGASTPLPTNTQTNSYLSNPYLENSYLN